MALDRAFFDSWTPRAQGLLRIVAGFMYLQHGSAKFLDIPRAGQFDKTHLLTLGGVGGVLELVGGTLLLFGLFTRPVAFILSGEMAVAYFIGHALKPDAALLVPLLNRGELAVLYCFVFLFFSVAGAGAFSVDALRRGARTP